MALLRFPEILPEHATSKLDSEEPRDWLPPPEQVVDASAAACRSNEPSGLRDLLFGLGAPTLDMVVTPLSARACLLGAATGRAFYHHELRRRLPMPSALEPELAVWDQGTVPVWSDGVLTEPKYFSFFQEAPLPSFNPNHRRKWRAHELLHGAVRFFWHPQCTRFDIYVSSRINELLPVIHWYHLDEVFRPRCPRHKGQILYREYCQACEDAAHPYWETDPSQHDRDTALGFVDGAWDHLREEWQAILAEIRTGRRHETPRPYLNASSDAVGYMRAHWNRATAWSFGQWAELFLVDGEDYFSDLSQLARHSAGIVQQLVSGDITVSPAQFEAARARRQLQDLAYRAMLALEWLDEGSPAADRAEDALMPQLELAADLSARLLQPTVKPGSLEDVPRVMAQICDAFVDVIEVFPDDVAQNFLGLGYLWDNAKAHVDAAVPMLRTGLETALPETMPLLAQELGDEFEAILHDFPHSEHFGELGRLAGRFARWLGAQATFTIEPLTLAMAEFEAWAAEEPRLDEDAELFATVPDEPRELSQAAGHLRTNTTLRRATFPTALVARLTGDDLRAGSTVQLAAIYMHAELRLIVEDAATTQIFDALQSGNDLESWLPTTSALALESLCDSGFVIWLPRPHPSI